MICSTDFYERGAPNVKITAPRLRHMNFKSGIFLSARCARFPFVDFACAVRRNVRAFWADFCIIFCFCLFCAFSLRTFLPFAQLFTSSIHVFCHRCHSVHAYSPHLYARATSGSDAVHVAESDRIWDKRERVAKMRAFFLLVGRQEITIFEHTWHMECIFQVRVARRANGNQHVSHILGT